jgi:hypothetical protein
MTNVNSTGKVFSVSYLKGQARRTRNGERVTGEPVLLELTPYIEGEGVFDSKSQFLPFTVNAWANRKFGQYGWGDFVTDMPETLIDIVSNGYKHDVFGEFVCVFANWRDQAGKAVLVRKESGIRRLSDVGLNTNMAVIGESMKTAKYVNRWLAPTDMRHTPVWGKEVADSWIPESQEFEVELENGTGLTFKLVWAKDLTPEGVANKDGQIGLSTRAHRALGLTNNPAIGDSWRVSLLTQRGFGKGHTIYQPDQAVDVVIYMPKKLVNSVDEFCFSSLGPLHSGNPRTDIQSVTNFKLHRQVGVLAYKYMRYVYTKSLTARAMEELLIQTVRSDDDIDTDLDDELPVDHVESWLFRRVMKSGLNPKTFPGLERRAIRFLMSSIMNCEKYVVPMNTTPELSVATSKYMSGDPFAIQPDGTPDMSLSVIQEGACCTFDVADGTPVIVYRQPNENSNAFYRLINRHYPQFKDSVGSSVVFMGRGVQKVMNRLGGGDMDDNIIIVTDPKWVKHFDSLSYPETDKLVAIESGLTTDVEDLAEMGIEDSFDVKTFGVEHMKHQILNASGRGQVGIGPVVNVDMIDMLLSDPGNLASMVADIQYQGYGQEYIDHLVNRLKYSSAFLATNLEIVIDAAVKDPGLLVAMNGEAQKYGADDVKAFIKNFHTGARVYPKCMTIGKIRIPDKKWNLQDFVVVRTPQCRMQERIIQVRNELMQKFAKNEWALVKKADPFIVNLVPITDTVKEALYGSVEAQRAFREGERPYAAGLRAWWAARWARNSQLVSQNPENSDDKIYGRICAEMESRLRTLDPAIVEGMAIELYHTLYQSDSPIRRLDPISGATRNYHDGLLWTNLLGNAFLNVLQRNDLLGAVLPVNLYLDKYLAGKKGIKVTVKDGLVYKVAGNKLIGTVAAVDRTGMMTMSYGFLRFKAIEHPALLPKPGLDLLLEPWVEAK